MDKFTLENTTIAAYRVFETLKFLVKRPASVPEIVKYLESLDPDDPKGYSKAVVYKYLTTLKFAGITLVSKKCKYEVKDLPFKINFSDDNLKALAILNNVLETIPEKDLSEKISEFFYQLKMRYSLDVEKFEEKKNSVKQTLNITKPTKEQAKTLQEYEDYCCRKFRLQISYYDLNGEVESSIFEPLDVKFEDKQVLLCAYCTKTNTFFELNSKQIIEIKQTPSKSLGKFFSSTTVFKLKGRLAKVYTLRNEEQIIGNDSDGNLMISNKKEPKDKLFLRLMRYADKCEVMTSKRDREFMIKEIDSALRNYEGT